jgi:hypothetical protein
VKPQLVVIYERVIRARLRRFPITIAAPAHSACLVLLWASAGGIQIVDTLDASGAVLCRQLAVGQRRRNGGSADAGGCHARASERASCKQGLEFGLAQDAFQPGCRSDVQLSRKVNAGNAGTVVTGLAAELAHHNCWGDTTLVSPTRSLSMFDRLTSNTTHQDQAAMGSALAGLLKRLIATGPGPVRIPVAKSPSVVVRGKVRIPVAKSPATRDMVVVRMPVAKSPGE